MKKQAREQPGKPPGRPRCSETDERILQATLRRLAEEGYSRMSLDAIAAEAGTTKPTIYRRWPGKEALAVAALEQLQSHQQPVPTGATREDLVALLRDFRAKLLRPNGMAMIGTLLVEERHTPELLRLFRERIVGPRRRGLLALLCQARQRGELRAGADLEAAVGLLVGSFYAQYLTGDGIPKDWPERVVEVVLEGLRK
jgi:AcrR family transcriptional regulator